MSKGYQLDTRSREEMQAKIVSTENALTALIMDTQHFAQMHHQGYHSDVEGTYETCKRGLCPGVVRSLARAQAGLRA